MALVIVATACGQRGELSAADHYAVAAATAGAPGRSQGCRADPGSAPAAGTEARVDLPAGGLDRWYLRFVPGSYDGTPAPLVVDLHGYVSGATGQADLSNLRSTAEEAGFVVATPQGNGDLAYWNATPEAELPDDVEFVADVIDDVGAELCIDPTRVYVDGFSNGAFLASLVACHLADRVAAVAAVAGLLLPEDCRPARPVPVLAVHGTEDRYVSFGGGPGPELAELDWDDESRAAFDGLPFADVRTAAGAWAGLDGCDPAPMRVDVAGTVELFHYDGCAGGADVALYVVDGGGHTWPGSALSHASRSILGLTTDGIDANDLIWSFFAGHPMPDLEPRLAGPGIVLNDVSAAGGPASSDWSR